MKKLFLITSIASLLLGSCNSGNKPQGGEESADTLKDKKAAVKPKDENPYKMMMDHYNELSDAQYRSTQRIWLTVADAQELVDAAQKSNVSEIDLIPIAYDKETGAAYAKKMGVKIEDVIDRPTLLFALTLSGGGGGGTQPLPAPPKTGGFCPPPQSCDSMNGLIAKATPKMLAMTEMVKHYSGIKTENYRGTNRMWMTVGDMKMAITVANKAQSGEISFFFCAYDKANAESFVKTHKGTKLSDIENRMSVIVVSPGTRTVNGDNMHLAPFISIVPFCPPPESCNRAPSPPAPPRG